MRQHLAGAATIKEMMRQRRDLPMVPLSESKIRIVEPDAATIERSKVIMAAAAERAAKAAAAPPPPAPEPERGPGADQDPRYSETTRWALGVANTARKDLELLETYVRVYNSVKRAAEDPAHLETIRASIGDERLAGYVARQQNNMVGYGSTAWETAANLSRSYSLSAAPLVRDASGFLSITDFTMKKTGPGWNLVITSTGAATVFAGGEDVSALVDNRRMAGGVWIQRAPGQSTELIA